MCRCRSRPWLLWVWVYFQSPMTRTAYPTAKEAPTLFQIEDALVPDCFAPVPRRYAERLRLKDDVNSTSTAKTSRGFQRGCRKIHLPSLPAYKFDFGDKNDPALGAVLRMCCTRRKSSAEDREQRSIGPARKKGRRSLGEARSSPLDLFPFEAATSAIRKAAPTRAIRSFRIRWTRG